MAAASDRSPDSAPHLQPLHESCKTTGHRLGAGWLVWCSFVIYGSLVPFDYRPVEWDAAIARFVHMPRLDLGLGSRLDWLANVLLYVPVGFLGTLALDQGERRLSAPHNLPRAAWSALLAFSIGSILAISIEFAQVFFAPRTVSLNDLLAELLGTAIGCAAAALAGRRFEALLGGLGAAAPSPAHAWLKVYLLIYLGLSFFPFDFSTAMAVFDQKLLEGHAAWWWAPVNAAQPQLALLKLGVEVLLTLPFGLALGGAPWRLRWPVAALLGLAAGMIIEVSQLFLLSAVSQGASVASRSVGLAGGALLAPYWAVVVRPWASERRMRIIAALGAIPWFLAIAYLTGWGREAIVYQGWAERAAALHYLPFYYHYYVGESRALTSVLLVSGTYSVVGIAFGLAWRKAPTWLAPALAFAIAASFEASKLLLAGQRPDPTNALIAAVAAWLTQSVVRRLLGGSADATGPGPSIEPSTTAMRETHEPRASGAIGPASLWGLAAAAAIVVTLRIAHGHPIAMATAMLVGVVCVWRQPLSALLLAPVLMSLTDINAYTGRRWLDLDDMLMLALFAIALLRRPSQPTSAERPTASSMPLWLSCLLLPGVFVGARDIDWLDPNALLTPLGSAHGLLAAKGLLWALMLVLFVRRQRLDPGDVATAFGRGMMLALGGVVALTVYERLAFVGPFGFASDYRAPGPFTEIAVGGAYIECFLAAAVPFAVVAAFHERTRLLRWGAAVLVPAATYATMVTFSRGGQVVFLAAVVAAALLAIGRRSGHRPFGERFAAWTKGVALAGAVAVVAGAILLSPYAVTRFQQLGEDTQVRLDHWAEGLGFSRDDTLATLFGNGLGSFGRESYFQGTPKTRPGMFSLHEEAGNHWLRSHAGSLSYLDQRVDASYRQELILRARLRSLEGNGLQALLCEKDLVQSRQCGIANLQAPASADWQPIELRLSLPANPNAGWPPRPIRFTLFHGGRGTVDIDDLSLKTLDGTELLSNGSFEGQGARWLYSSDKHLTWHMKNLWLQVYFESGWAGVLAHSALLLLAVFGAWRAAKIHGIYWLAFVIALLAFQGVGLIDSVIDSAHFLQLYLSMAFLACTASSSPHRANTRRPSSPATGATLVNGRFVNEHH